MQKKLLILLTVALVGSGLALQIGLDTIVVGWFSSDSKGGIISLSGLNTGFGISYRSYFEPLYPGKGSLYWEAGTAVGILFPSYVGIGYDYRFNEFYVGGGVLIDPLGLLMGSLDPIYPIYPKIRLPGAWPIYLSIHLGVVFVY